MVLRVDSPGGSVLASEEIYRELQALRAAGKPVVVSMSDLRRLRRLLHLRAGRRDLGQPGDHHRLDRHLCHHPDHRQDARQDRRERGRRRHDAAVGRSCASTGRSARTRARCCSRRSSAATTSSWSASPPGARRHASRSTRSRRAACGRAAMPSASGWSTSSAASTMRSRPRRGAPSCRLRARVHRARAHLGRGAGAGAEITRGAGAVPGQPLRAGPRPDRAAPRSGDARGGAAGTLQRAQPPVRLLLLRDALAARRAAAARYSVDQSRMTLPDLPEPMVSKPCWYSCTGEVMGDDRVERRARSAAGSPSCTRSRTSRGRRCP